MVEPFVVLLSGTVFINRGNNRSAVASMTQAGEDMKRKRVSVELDKPTWLLRSLRCSRSLSDIPLDLPGRDPIYERRSRLTAIQEGSILSRCTWSVPS